MNFASSFTYVGSKTDETESFAVGRLRGKKKARTTRNKRPKPSSPPPPPSLSAPRSSKSSQGGGGFFSSFFKRKPTTPTNQAPLYSEKEKEEELSASSGSWSDSESEEDITRDEKVRKVKKADANILNIELRSLADDAMLFTGDATYCSSCAAMFSCLSKITEKDDDQIWKCEFCEAENPVMLDEEEIPVEDTIDYLVKPPAEAKDDDDSRVVFCVDVSGSMCCTMEVSGEEWKTKKQQKDDLSQFMDKNSSGIAADQHLPGEKRDVTYVSRLECVQAAIDAQIDSIVKEHPNKRVVIVTFSNEVTLYRPNSSPLILAGDKLDDYDYLLKVAKEDEEDYPPISKGKKELEKVLHGLQEKGQTALGPALLVSIGLAGAKRGSSVVLCTDGQANIGLGALEGKDDDSMVAFYDKASKEALDRGVAVSIVSIKGTNCTLEHIAKVADTTKGINHEADPLKLTKNFNFILQNQIIATDVKVKMIIHRGLKFRGEDGVTGSQCSRDVGNATTESIITFSYSPKSDEDVAKLTSLESLPFQVQIHYTKMDGSQCVRVVSKSEKVTNKREEAEKDLNVAVVGLYAQKEAAKLAQKGCYTKARMKQKAAMRMVKKQAVKTEEQKKHFSRWKKEAARLDDALLEAKEEEIAEGLDYCSDEDDLSDSEGEEETSNVGLFDRLMSRKTRRKKNDKISNHIYQAKNAMPSVFDNDCNPLYE